MVDLDELLCCPKTGQALLAGARHFQTEDGAERYPVVDGSPWLLREPGFAIGEWQARWHMEIERLKALISAAPAAEMAYPKAVRLHIEELRGVLGDLVAAKAADLSSYLALRTRLPPSMGLTSYYHNVHRDWVWGDEENALSLSAVAAGFPDDCEHLLVLGSGAGRLAYDLHNRDSGISRTVALDLNPLLVSIARRVAAGESVALHEFPIAPRYREHRAIARTLSAPASRAGLQFLVGDAFDPPLGTGQFDAVVTPWFVDVVGRPYADTAAIVNRLLKPGGVWIVFGSFAFDFTHPDFDLCVRDVPALNEELGFSDTAVSEQQMPYMDCPVSRHGRVEETVVITSTKCRDIASPVVRGNTPEWIVTATAPVPALAAFAQQAQSTKIHAYIMSLIDGERSINDIAAVLERQKLMEQQEAVGVLRGFLLKMWDEASASRSYR